MEMFSSSTEDFLRTYTNRNQLATLPCHSHYIMKLQRPLTRMITGMPICYLQQSNGDFTFHSCRQMNLHVEIQLDVDSQTILLLLLGDLFQ